MDWHTFGSLNGGLNEWGIEFRMTEIIKSRGREGRGKERGEIFCFPLEIV